MERKQRKLYESIEYVRWSVNSSKNETITSYAKFNICKSSSGCDEVIIISTASISLVRQSFIHRSMCYEKLYNSSKEKWSMHKHSSHTHTENWLCWKTPWVITNFHSVMCFCVKLVTRFIVGVTSFDLFALSFRRISFCVPPTRRSSTMVWITQSSSVHASAVHNIAHVLMTTMRMIMNLYVFR